MFVIIMSLMLTQLETLHAKRYNLLLLLLLWLYSPLLGLSVSWSYTHLVMTPSTSDQGHKAATYTQGNTNTE
jgi:disulfide bond formation protein DsbB